MGGCNRPEPVTLARTLLLLHYLERREGPLSRSQCTGSWRSLSVTYVSHVAETERGREGLNSGIVMLHPTAKAGMGSDRRAGQGSER